MKRSWAELCRFDEFRAVFLILAALAFTAALGGS
jgi:hypothetical protein